SAVDVTTADAARCAPSVRAYQATPCTHPVSRPPGEPAPSISTATPGVMAAKSSFGQSRVEESVASDTRTISSLKSAALAIGAGSRGLGAATGAFRTGRV